MLRNNITAGDFEARELERINQAAERLNCEATDVLDYQSIDRLGSAADAKKRGRGRPRHTNRPTQD
jgi:hypothetical protein